MLKLKALDFSNGGSPGSRAIGGISAAPIALRVLLLEAGNTCAEVWFASSRNSEI